MDKFNFLQIIQNPALLNTSMRDDLLDIAENYPYFQGVYALLSKLENKQDTISQAAIRTANRDVLKDFLEIKTKKKDKREIINNLNLNTEQVNAFDKFENLEEQEVQTEVLDEIELKEVEENQEEQVVITLEGEELEETLMDEPISIEKELPHQIAHEEVEEKELKESEGIEEIIEEVSLKLEEDFPVFDEPDYFTEDTSLNTQINQTDTSKELPDYKENIEKGSFFDAISDDEFVETNYFEEKDLNLNELKSSFKETKKDSQENGIEEKKETHTEVKSEQEIPNSATNTSKNELHYNDFHLKEGETLAPDSKVTAKEIQTNPKPIQYEDYHLTAAQKEAKIITTKITENKANTQNTPPKEEEKDKPTGSFFDSF